MTRKAGPGPAPVPVHRLLQRVRWSLTAWFSLALAACVAVLAVIVAAVDSDRRHAALDADLASRAALVREQVVAGRTDPGGRAVRGPAELAVVSTVADSPTVRWRGGGAGTGVGDDQLAAIARQAAVRGEEVRDDIPDRTGRLRRAVAVPITTDRIAVVAVAGTDRPDAAHRLVVGGLVLAGTVAVVLFAVVAWALLGYVLAPVTRSLAAQESFLATAAHDLRTPLATLRTLLDSARRGPGDGGERGDGAHDDIVERSARLVARTSGIVEDLVLRARLAAGTLPVRTRLTRLDQVVEAVVTDLAGAGPPPETAVGEDGVLRLALSVDGHEIMMSAAPTVALVDPALVERAVANLVHNALRHGHEPGQPARIEVVVDSDGRLARVTVTDAGPGLPVPVPDSGLGLSVVRWAARAHSGALLLGTGPGATIRLVLPARTPAHRPTGSWRI